MWQYFCFTKLLHSYKMTALFTFNMQDLYFETNLKLLHSSNMWGYFLKEYSVSKYGWGNAYVMQVKYGDI